jgi:hypothetical protein
MCHLKKNYNYVAEEEFRSNSDWKLPAARSVIAESIQTSPVPSTINSCGRKKPFPVEEDVF